MNYHVDSNVQRFLKKSTFSYGENSPPNKHNHLDTYKREGIEDPTYLTFYIRFDFGSVSQKMDGNRQVSGLFLPVNDLDSAANYLMRTNQFERADYLEEFREQMRYLSKDAPWYFQSIGGLNDVLRRQEAGKMRGYGKELTISCNESLDMRMSFVADLYRKASYDFTWHRELLPVPQRLFNMQIIISEIRNIGFVGDAVETFIDSDGGQQQYTDLNAPKDDKPQGFWDSISNAALNPLDSFIDKNDISGKDITGIAEEAFDMFQTGKFWDDANGAVNQSLRDAGSIVDGEVQGSWLVETFGDIQKTVQEGQSVINDTLENVGVTARGGNPFSPKEPGPGSAEGDVTNVFSKEFDQTFRKQYYLGDNLAYVTKILDIFSTHRVIILENCEFVFEEFPYDDLDMSNIGKEFAKMEFKIKVGKVVDIGQYGFFDWVLNDFSFDSAGPQSPTGDRTFSGYLRPYDNSKSNYSSITHQSPAGPDVNWLTAKSRAELATTNSNIYGTKEYPDFPIDEWVAERLGIHGTLLDSLVGDRALDDVARFESGIRKVTKDLGNAIQGITESKLGGGIQGIIAQGNDIYNKVKSAEERADDLLHGGNGVSATALMMEGYDPFSASKAIRESSESLGNAYTNTYRKGLVDYINQYLNRPEFNWYKDGVNPYVKISGTSMTEDARIKQLYNRFYAQFEENDYNRSVITSDLYRSAFLSSKQNIFNSASLIKYSHNVFNIPGQGSEATSVQAVQRRYPDLGPGEKAGGITGSPSAGLLAKIPTILSNIEQLGKAPGKIPLNPNFKQNAFGDDPPDHNYQIFPSEFPKDWDTGLTFNKLRKDVDKLGNVHEYKNIGLEGAPIDTDIDGITLTQTDPSNSIQSVTLEGTNARKDIQPTTLTGANPRKDIQSITLTGAEPSKNLQDVILQGAEPIKNLQDLKLVGAEPIRNLQDVSLDGATPSTGIQDTPLTGATPSNRLQSNPLTGFKPKTSLQENPLTGLGPIGSLQESILEGIEPSTTIQPVELTGLGPSGAINEIGLTGVKENRSSLGNLKLEGTKAITKGSAKIKLDGAKSLSNLSPSNLKLERPAISSTLSPNNVKLSGAKSAGTVSPSNMSYKDTPHTDKIRENNVGLTGEAPKTTISPNNVYSQ